MIPTVPVRMDMFEPLTFKSIEEKNTYELLTQNKRTPCEWLKIQNKFFENNERIRIECQNAGYNGMWAGATLGVIASIAYLIIFGVVYPIIAGLGILLSGLTGGYLGFKICYHTKYYYITRSKAFLDWKVEAIKNNVYAKFRECLMKDEVLDGLKDCFTLELMLDPVRDRCGHVYEKAAIHQYLRENNGKVQCPLGGGVENTPKNRQYIRYLELEPHKEYTFKVCQRIYEILIKFKEEKVEIEKPIKQGMIAFLNTYKEENDAIYIAETNILNNSLNFGYINTETHLEKTKMLIKEKDKYAHWNTNIS